MKEIWAPVDGYDGYYAVSNLGNVMALERTITRNDGVVHVRKQRMCRFFKDRNGYVKVKLSKDGTTKTFSVHRLVAMAFVDGYTAEMEVNHIDHNRENNVADNLEWVTHTENIEWTRKAGRHVSQIMDFSGKNNPNYGNTKLHERYASDAMLAKEKQSRPGEINGRAISIRMLKPSGESIDFPYITACAKYAIDAGLSKLKDPYGVSSHMSKAAKSGREYLGVRYQFI